MTAGAARQPVRALVLQRQSAYHKSGNDMTTRIPTPASRKTSSLRNKLLVAGAIILFLLVFGELWRRISQAAQLRSLERQIGAQVTQLSEESNRKATEIAESQSDAAVADWARKEGRMILPGEVLVQPLAPTAAATAAPPEETSDGDVPNWRVWWKWLWGSE
jgi:cell division protein FtsB